MVSEVVLVFGLVICLLSLLTFASSAAMRSLRASVGALVCSLWSATSWAAFALGVAWGLAMDLALALARIACALACFLILLHLGLGLLAHF